MHFFVYLNSELIMNWTSILLRFYLVFLINYMFILVSYQGSYLSYHVTAATVRFCFMVINLFKFSGATTCLMQKLHIVFQHNFNLCISCYCTITRHPHKCTEKHYGSLSLLLKSLEWRKNSVLLTHPLARVCLASAAPSRGSAEAHISRLYAPLLYLISYVDLWEPHRDAQAET